MLERKNWELTMQVSGQDIESESEDDYVSESGSNSSSSEDSEEYDAFEEFKRLAKENELMCLREKVCSVKFRMKEMDIEYEALKNEIEKKARELSKTKLVLSMTQGALSTMVNKAEQSNDIIKRLHEEIRQVNQDYGLSRDRVRDFEMEMGLAHAENQFLIEENKKLKRKYEEV